MSQAMHLIGSEDVSRAGYNMQHAAEDMKRAADTFAWAIQDLKEFMGGWLERFEAMLKDDQPQKISLTPCGEPEGHNCIREMEEVKDE